MNKYCITTLVSTNHYQYFLPGFIWSARKFLPNTDIKVFVHGKLREEIRPYCTGAEIIEDMFLEYHSNTMINSLRFLIPRSHFKGYEYIYITDADFIFLKQGKSHMDYFSNMMRKMHTVYAGLKGTRRKPRIMGGYFMVKYKWFKKTMKMRGRYLARLLKLKKVSTYYDEYMLYSICSESGLGVPARRRCFQNGVRINPEYRNLHIGDMKLKRRYAHPQRMRWYFCTQNRRKYLKLLGNVEFRRTLKIMRRNKMVKDLLAKVKEYAHK